MNWFAVVFIVIAGGFGAWNGVNGNWQGAAWAGIAAMWAIHCLDIAWELEATREVLDVVSRDC